MPGERSVLIVAAEPDDRECTSTLQAVVAELAGRSHVDVAVWFLGRSDATEPWWPDARVVDDLRLWAPARSLELIGLGAIGRRLRGLRLRQWGREVAPDVVIMDDGVGDRILRSVGGHPTLVVRRNAEVSPRPWLEPPPRTTADLVLEPDPGASGMRSTKIIEVAPIQQRAAVARAAVRTRLGLEPGDALVVGWGRDGWLDGPDLFVRALWHLEHREGVLAHGLWLAGGDDPDEEDRLVAEARRCGVAHRFHVQASDQVDHRLGGDVAFLPYREPTDVRHQELLTYVAAGLHVVGFSPWAVPDPALQEVPFLDLDGAASALAAALRGSREERLAQAHARLDLVDWVDELLAATAGPR